METNHNNRSKIIIDNNLNTVEVSFLNLVSNFQFCTDKCLESDYNNSELNKQQKECLTNCFSKIFHLRKSIDNQHNKSPLI